MESSGSGGGVNLSPSMAVDCVFTRTESLGPLHIYSMTI